MKIRILFVLLGGLLAPLCAQANDSCPSLNSPEDAINCVLSNHPDVLQLESQKESAASLLQQTRQIPNPELSLEAVPNGDGGMDNEIILSQLVEIGGKRGHRQAVARFKADAVSAQVTAVKERLAIEVAQALWRLRQIQQEMRVLEEADETGRIVQRQYSRLIRLNPEQEVSLGVLRISEDQHRLQMNDLISEKKKILAALETGMRKPLPSDEKVLPRISGKWPAAPSRGSTDRSSAQVAEAEALLKSAQSERDLSRSERWPALAIGPKIQYDTGSKAETKVGVALALPLPLFHQNQAGVAFANAEVRRAEAALLGARALVDSERKRLEEVYVRTVVALGESSSRSSLELKHDLVHKHLASGLLAPMLVVELHRQLFDHRKTLHEQEMKALDALLQLRLLNGTLLKEKLP